MSVAAQVLQQAEALKVTVADGWSGSNEAWVSRQNLQDLYQRLLVMDLEYALDKKVEQELWNHAFKNQINSLQVQAKEKQNPKRNEIQASLNLFLETASGFYHQLLQELCTAFQLDLPFRPSGSSYGIIKEYKPSNSKVRTPKKSSCLYVCQHCLVHLGDIARYRQQTDQAQSYYRHAAWLVPYNGQPYNQLAILEAAKGNKLATVFYYIRSIAVKHPFPAATTNLEKFYAKLTKDSQEYKGKLSVNEVISTFLQFHALVHMSSDLDKAKKLEERLTLALPAHITSGSLTSTQLCRMLAINLFAMHHATRKLTPVEDSPKDSAASRDSSKDSGKTECLSPDEELCYEMVLNFTVALFDHLLHLIPKQEQKAKESYTLAAIKLVLDWVTSEKDLLKKPVFTSHMIWPNMSKLLNNLQYQKDSTAEMDKYVDMPLPEDCDLQHFVPMQKAYSDLDFGKVTVEGLESELETRLRCRRIVSYGTWISDNFPMTCFLKYQKNKMGKAQFTAPGGLQIKATLEDAVKTGAAKHVATQAIVQKPVLSRSDPGTTSKKTTAHSNHADSQQKLTSQKSAKSASSSTSSSAKESTDPKKAAAPKTKSSLTAGGGRKSSNSTGTSPTNISSGVAVGGSARLNSTASSAATEPKPTTILQKPHSATANPGVLPVNSALGVVPFDPSIPPPIAPARPALGGPDQAYGSGPGPPFNLRGPPPSGPMGYTTTVPPPSRTSPYTGLTLPNPAAPATNIMSAPPPQQQAAPALAVGTPPRGDGMRVGYSDLQGYNPGGFGSSHSPPQPGMPPGPAQPPFSGNVYNTMEDQNNSPMYALLNHNSIPGQDLYNPPLVTDTRFPPPVPGGMKYSQLPMGSSAGHGEPASFLANNFNKPDNLKRGVDLSALNIKPQAEPNMLPFRNFDFPPPDFGFEEGIPKPDSPPSAGRIRFDETSNGFLRDDPRGRNTYQLFSESPWSVPIKPRVEHKSPTISPFASSGSSVRTTPDLLRAENQDPAIVAAGMPIGRTSGMIEGEGWGGSPYPGVIPEEKPGFAATLQSIWTSGPSPLEKLLEQQKMQRHGDPH